jgi:hypothetical protein
MVITKLAGGLGNQMFQYAAGRRLAHTWDTTLKLDISGFEKDDLRTYDLGVFNIQAVLATPAESAILTGRKRNVGTRLLSRLLRRPPPPAPGHVRKKNLQFDPAVLNLPDNVYLDGYWQSERYFADIDAVIRQEFTVKTAQQGQNKAMAELISAAEAVSLHVRRGDYVSAPVANRILGPCDLDYYHRAVDQLTRRLGNQLHFFVFSDEPAWVRQHLDLPYPTTIISHNGPEKSYEDLRLMSQCRHHIIANSSFSWWGAWLCPYPHKIVIAPRQWFRDPAWSSADIVPAGWLRL